MSDIWRKKKHSYVTPLPESWARQRFEIKLWHETPSEATPLHPPLSVFAPAWSLFHWLLLKSSLHQRFTSRKNFCSRENWPRLDSSRLMLSPADTVVSRGTSLMLHSHGIRQTVDGKQDVIYVDATRRVVVHLNLSEGNLLLRINRGKSCEWGSKFPSLDKTILIMWDQHFFCTLRSVWPDSSLEVWVSTQSGAAPSAPNEEGPLADTGVVLGLPTTRTVHGSTLSCSWTGWCRCCYSISSIKNISYWKKSQTQNSEKIQTPLSHQKHLTNSEKAGMLCITKYCVSCTLLGGKKIKLSDTKRKKSKEWQRRLFSKEQMFSLFSWLTSANVWYTKWFCWLYGLLTWLVKVSLRQPVSPAKYFFKVPALFQMVSNGAFLDASVQQSIWLVRIECHRVAVIYTRHCRIFRHRYNEENSLLWQ